MWHSKKNKTMKKVLLSAFAAIAFSALANAQIADISIMEKKGTVASKDYDIHFIGLDGQRAIFVQNTSLLKDMKGNRLRNKKILVSYDMNQEELARVELCDDKTVLCYGGFLNGDNVDLLMVEKEDNNLRVFRDRRNSQTFQPVGQQQTLAQFSGSKGDNLMFLCQSSPNDNLLAGIYVVDRENQSAELQVGLYGKDLDEYWKMDSRCRSLSFVYVTDSGEVLLGSHTDEGLFRIFVIDGENEAMYDFDTKTSGLSNVMVVNYADNRIYLAATHSKKDHESDHNTMADAILSFCYDTHTKDLLTDRHDFSKLECNRMNNEDDDRRIRNDDFRIEFFDTKQTLPEKEGGYAMFDQTCTRYINGAASTYHHWGMMVARIDKNGKFEWVKTSRLATVCEYANRTLLSYRWMPTSKGITLVWAANSRNPRQDDTKQISALHNIQDEATLALLRYDADGNDTRQYIPLKSSYGLVGYPHKTAENEYFMLFTGLFKGRFATMKLK